MILFYGQENTISEAGLAWTPVCAAFAGLGYRLVDLQVLRHQELSALAQKNTCQLFLLEPRRGDIVDARGNLLATGTFVKRVCADPSLVGTNQSVVARALAPLLQMDEAHLVQLLTPTLRRGHQRHQRGQRVRAVCLPQEARGRRNLGQHTHRP